MRILICLAAAVLSGSVNAADNWPGFRGPNGDGVSTAKNVSTTWTETENVRWKVPIHDKGWSSPVVWGNQVWLTTALSDGKKFFAVCLDKTTGKVVFDKLLFTADNPPNIAQYNSFASPTPFIEEGRIYVHFGTHGTACLNTVTGDTIWKRNNLPCDHWRGPGSSPVVYKDKLFLMFDGYDKQYTACLNKATGDTIWEKDRKLPYPDNGDLKKAFATPSVFEFDGKAQVVCSAAVGTIAHDVGTGEEVWRVIHGGMNEACRPILAHGLIYLTTGHTSNLIAVKAGRTGDLTKDGIAWRADKIAPSRPSPLVVGDLLYVVSDNGVLTCLDAKTGKKQWQERLEGGKFSASPVSADGHVYFVSESGKVVVLKARPEFEKVATNQLDMTTVPADGGKVDVRCMASPAVVDGLLFLRNHTHLYCIGKK
ncbi:outer membrane protein assembly factor BamB family protein [Limnoglobus roseus]|uniref:Quinonprotein alcohol dehydrogenase n=1 Tax=Limnoglobus roseus TaxID=2598579 RepID=A0A5C1AN83_9BACT|nr:PQQ-binding-like beta-propeller repeat protein [Limnoglobus roseus]QEL20025.1 quinonprotein alcohol dehydrogenase [Limnoglobus roseus]